MCSSAGFRLLLLAAACCCSWFVLESTAVAWQSEPAPVQTESDQADHSHDHSHDHTGHEQESGEGRSGDETSPAASSEPFPLPLLQLAVYCLLIVGASLLGGWLPSLIRLTHDRMQMLMSLAGGLMLGIGMYHMLPHAVHELGSLDRGIWWMMIGLIVMFLLIRTFHFHQHEPPELELSAAAEMPEQDSGKAAGQPVVPASGQHSHSHSHKHGHSHEHCSHDHAAAHELGWVGVFAGLSLHTLIDGIALAASVQAEASHAGGGLLPGVGTFLAVMLHKPLDAVSITSLMTAGGWKPASRNLVNLAYSCMCPLGVALFAAGMWQMQGYEHVVVGCALAFAAGVFVCISLGDILPEMEFHSHNRVLLSVLLLTGIALAWGIGFLEPAHSHGH